MSDLSALQTHGLGKRYGSLWALRDCSLDVPAGSVTALVGPNGAGKTTLLQLAVGLTKPTTGDVLVFGGSPLGEPQAVLPRVGFVAQDHPLHRGFRISETLELGRRLNPTWDQEAALERIERLRLPLGQKVGRLSGGQQAQVALTLALAKRPDLLLLDEPVAALDPLARREFMTALMEVAADGDVTIVLSSHIVTDLERVCDHLVILAQGQTQLAGPIDEIVAGHRLLTGPRSDPSTIARTHQVIHERHTERQTTLLVRADGHVYDACWQVHDLELEDIVLAYLGYGAAGDSPRQPLPEAVAR